MLEIDAFVTKYTARLVVCILYAWSSVQSARGPSTSTKERVTVGYNATSPTVRAGILSNGTDSGLTKKCPRGPDRSRSAAIDVDVAHDMELRLVCPLLGLS